MRKMMMSPGIFFIFLILTFQAVRGLKGQKIVQNENNNYISHMLYLRNSIVSA